MAEVDKKQKELAQRTTPIRAPSFIGAVTRITPKTQQPVSVSLGKAYTVDATLQTVELVLSEGDGAPNEPLLLCIYGFHVVYLRAPVGGLINQQGSILLSGGSQVCRVLKMTQNEYFAEYETPDSSWPDFISSSNTQVISVTKPASKVDNAYRVKMSNGMWAHREINGTETVVLANTGLWGRDPACALANGLWHLFAVPEDSGSFAIVLANNTTPGDGGGPPSYPVFRYLTSVVMVSNNCVAFQQTQDEYAFLDTVNSALLIVNCVNTQVTGSTWNPINGNAITGATGTATTKDIRTVVPINVAPKFTVGVHIGRANTTAATSTSMHAGYSTNESFAVESRIAGAATGSGTGYTNVHAISEGAFDFFYPSVPYVGFTGTVASVNFNASVTVRGFLNKLWGDR